MARRRKGRAYTNYLSQPFGLSRVMDESPYSDGSAARLIENWHLDERGFLVTDVKAMPLIPERWSVSHQFDLGTYQPPLKDTLAMAFMLRDGEIPELLFLTKTGVFRFTPWRRGTVLVAGQIAGCTEQKFYAKSGTSSSVKPTGSLRYPPQVEVVANKLYFTYCDGGAVWVWDGDRIRTVGFPQKPSPPQAEGPANASPDYSSKYSRGENAGGFSVVGRIGNAEANWTEEFGSSDPIVRTVGGVDVGHWRYAVVFEGSDGSYSQMSDPGGHVSMRKEVCSYKWAQVTGSSDTVSATADLQSPSDLLKSFKVIDIPKGPDNCVARIILRTRNLERLPPGDDGSFRFVHRLGNTSAVEWIDDIPDGDLGSAWQDREPFPVGPYFIRHFSGSMFYARTDGNPSRIWWSEQQPDAGPIHESILFGHWMEVFPETGPITGLVGAVLPGQQAGPVLLVFKQNAVHFIGGSYPSWHAGTLQLSAGCIGPGLIQPTPDGGVVWYGSNTFWRLSKDGVEDIGVSIRKRLQNINKGSAHLGVSWSDEKNKELVFWLPENDSTKPSIGFVWDYRASGWRILSTLDQVDAVLSIPSQSMILANAKFGDKRRVWVYGRGYTSTHYSYNSNHTAKYVSGWLTLSEFDPTMHAAKKGSWVVFTGEDFSTDAATLSVFKDHNNLDKVTEDQDILACHAEDLIPEYGVSSYFHTDWREPRIFSTQLPIDAPNARSIQIQIETSGRMSMFNVDLYGPIVSGPFSRVPGGEG